MDHILSRLHNVYIAIEDKRSEILKLIDSSKGKIVDEKDISMINGAVAKTKEHIDFLESINNEINEENVKQIRHDTRSVFGTIKGYCELVFEDLDDIDLSSRKPEEINVIDKIKNTLEEAIVLIDGALDIISEINSNAFAGNTSNIGEDKSKSDGNNYCQIIYKSDDVIKNKNGDVFLKEELVNFMEEADPSNIIVIDDDTHKRNILKRRLEKLGHDVALAKDGMEGLDILLKEENKGTFDLILLDMLMPGLSGYEVLLKLKSNLATKDIPVLIVSSLHDADNIAECIRAGADDYLPMPFNPAILKARINSCINKKHLRDREKQREKELMIMKSQLEAAVAAMDAGLVMFDSDDMIVLFNEKFRKIYEERGEKLNGLIGMSYRELLRANYEAGVFAQNKRREKDPKNDSIRMEDFIDLMMDRHLNSEKPHLIELASGKWIEIKETKIKGGGILAIHNDVTEKKKDDDKVKFLALNDHLTGLANRNLFEKALASYSIKVFEKEINNFALFFIDLDGFKGINDTYGHDIGDLILKDFADKLKSIVRSNDLVARLGGDEFCIIMPDIKNESDVDNIAERILSSVSKPTLIEGKECDYGASIGVAMCPRDGEKPGAVLKAADQAMYEAKRKGRGIVCKAS